MLETDVDGHEIQFLQFSTLQSREHMIHGFENWPDPFTDRYSQDFSSGSSDDLMLAHLE